MNKLFLLIVVGCALLLSGCVKQNWSLLVCATPDNYKGGCDDVGYVLKEYKSQKDCMEKGIEIKNPAGFECGLSCKPWENSDVNTGSLMYICDEVCNEKGCN